jgi:hypothetical protein
MPTWLMPALRLFAMLSPEKKVEALHKLAGRKRASKTVPVRPSAQPVNRHPFARIEEL